MKETDIVEKYELIKDQLDLLGITLEVIPTGEFHLPNVPGSRGLIIFDSLDSLNDFIYGFTTGLNASKNTD